MAHEVLRGGEEVWIQGNLAAPELAQVFRALGRTLKSVKVTNSNLFPDTTDLSERVTTVKLVTNSVDEIEAEVRRALTVRELGLDHYNLLAEHVAAIASSLESFPMLQKLSLRGEAAGDTGGKALGDLLQSSTSLRVLEVDCCKLGIEGLPHLARGITHSTSLRELYLSCQGTPNYEDVCHPVTQLLFDSFRANQSLKTLRLENLGIDDTAAVRLYDALSSCENLRVLDLTNNRLHAMTLVDLFLEHNEYLEEIVLVRNNINNAGAQTLADGVLRHPRLLRLELWKNPISDEGFAALCKSAGEHPSLEYLNLCGLNPNVAGINSLTTLMSSNRLRRLNLHECGLGNHGAARIATGLAATRHLVLLNLKHNKIGAEGANALGAGLAQNTTLEELLLGENELGDAGAAALSSGLGTHPRLRIIDLGDNQIGDVGACALGACLKTNKVLQDLILWYNHIGEVGTQGLAEGLGTLQALLLGNNKNVGDAGALAVAGRLGRLRVIDMFATSLTDRGVTALANALIESPHARELSVNNVTITDEGALALANLLRRSKTLTQIGLHFKNMGRVGIEALSSALEANYMVTGDVEFLGMGMFADMANEDEEDDDEDGEEVMNPWADVMEYHFRLNATMAMLRAQLQVLEKSLLEMRFTLYICSRVCLMSAFEERRAPHDGITLTSGTASSSTISADDEASPHVIAKLQRIARFQDRIVAARAEIRDIFIRVPLVSQFLVEVDFVPPPFPFGQFTMSNKRRKLE